MRSALWKIKKAMQSAKYTSARRLKHLNKWVEINQSSFTSLGILQPTKILYWSPESKGSGLMRQLYFVLSTTQLNPTQVEEIQVNIHM